MVTRTFMTDTAISAIKRWWISPSFRDYAQSGSGEYGTSEVSENALKSVVKKLPSHALAKASGKLSRLYAELSQKEQLFLYITPTQKS